jgi:hypothetical protein
MPPVTMKFTDKESWYSCMTYDYLRSLATVAWFARKWPPEGSCSVITEPPSSLLFSQDVKLKLNIVRVCARTLSRQILDLPKCLLSHFCDIISSLGDTSGDGAADRRVCSDSEEAAEASGRELVRLEKKSWI